MYSGNFNPEKKPNKTRLFEPRLKDARRRDWCCAFVRQLLETIPARAPYTIPKRDLDPTFATPFLLGDILVEEFWKPGPSGGKQIALDILAGTFLLGRTTALKDLRFFARAGLVGVYANKAITGSKRLPFEFFVHPALQVAFRETSTMGSEKVKALLEASATLWLRRGANTRNLQGFGIDSEDVEFGSLSPDFKEAVNPLTSGLTALSRAPNGAREAKQERWQAALRARAFVRGCAEYWRLYRERSGFGSARPAWDADLKDLPASQRGAYHELTKLFNRYGGRLTGLAWMYFVSIKPEPESLGGKRNFDPETVYVTAVSSDKRPDQFGKHFMQIIGRPAFQTYAATPKALERCREIFGAEVFEFPGTLQTEKAPEAPSHTTQLAQEEAPHDQFPPTRI